MRLRPTTARIIMELAALLFTILFVGLKLAGFIAWSWFWVLSPLWIYAILLAVIWFFFAKFDG
jgi:hypothetical protein